MRERTAGEERGGIGVGGVGGGHNRSIHPLTGGELSPDDRAPPNALKSPFEDVLVHPWIHSLPTGGCSLGFVLVCVVLFILFYFFSAAPVKFS